MFKLFRTKPAVSQPDAPSARDSELRGTTLEGYHFAIRVERNRGGEAQRLIGWHGSSQGGGRVDLRRDPEGMWRNGQGRQAASVGDLLAPSVRRSAAWTAQWCEILPDGAAPDSAKFAPHAEPHVQEP